VGGAWAGAPVQEEFKVTYAMRQRDLGFRLKLLRAEQTVDPGTNKAATYTSFVQLTDPKEKIDGEDRVITMNQPLDHAGYKVYQSNYRFPGVDENLKSVRLYGVPLAHAPG